MKTTAFATNASALHTWSTSSALLSGVRPARDRRAQRDRAGGGGEDPGAVQPRSPRGTRRRPARSSPSPRTRRAFVARSTPAHRMPPARRSRRRPRPRRRPRTRRRRPRRASPAASASANPNSTSATPSLLSDSRFDQRAQVGRHGDAPERGDDGDRIGRRDDRAEDAAPAPNGSAPSSASAARDDRARSRAFPARASSAMRQPTRRSASRSRFQAASKISGGRNTNSNVSPNANGGATGNERAGARPARPRPGRERARPGSRSSTAAPSSATNAPTPCATSFMRSLRAARRRRARGSNGRRARVSAVSSGLISTTYARVARFVASDAAGLHDPRRSDDQHQLGAARGFERGRERRPRGSASPNHTMSGRHIPPHRVLRAVVELERRRTAGARRSGCTSPRAAYRAARARCATRRAGAASRRSA